MSVTIYFPFNKWNIEHFTLFSCGSQAHRITFKKENKMGGKELYKKRFIEIGLKIAYYRKLNGLTQEQLAEKISKNPKYLSNIETPSVIQPVSLKTLFSIADCLGIPPHKFLEFN